MISQMFIKVILILLPSILAAPISNISVNHLSGKSLNGSWELTIQKNFIITNKSMIHMGQSYESFFPIKSEKILEGFIDNIEGGQGEVLYLELYSSAYRVDHWAVMQIELGQIKNSTWKNQREFVSCLLFSGEQAIIKLDVAATVEVQIKQAGIQVQFVSDSFSFKAHLEKLKGLELVVLIQGIMTLGFILSLKFLQPRRSLYRISQWVILQSFAFILAANVQLGSVGLSKIDTHLWLFCLFALLNVSGGLFFLRNYEEVIYSFRTIRAFISGLLYFIIYLVLAYRFSGNPAFWVYETYILWALQIGYSYRAGGKGGISIKLLITICFTRIGYFYYIFGCTFLRRIYISSFTISLFICINAVALMIILLQYFYGSRFLVPRLLIPDYHNYNRKLFSDHKILKQQCPICQEQLNKTVGADNPQSESDKSQVAQISQSEMQEDAGQIIMETPCLHYYHVNCLTQWMEKRLNCPMCRANIPPLESQRDDSHCC